MESLRNAAADRRRGEDDVEESDLRKLAQDKIVAESGRALDATGEAAAALLADLYIVGLAHGVPPQYWAWVTDLPSACWDVARDVAARRRNAIALGCAKDPGVSPPGVGPRSGPSPAVAPQQTQVRRGRSR